MTFTRTEEFDVPENVLKKMVTLAIVYIDDGAGVREAVDSVYVRYLIDLPIGISAVYEKLEAELIDRIVERLCERELGRIKDEEVF